MTQAISGVSPAQTSEVPVMTVWPSITRFPLGRTLGKLYSIKFPDVYIFRLGNLIALATAPVGALLYLFRLLPSFFGLPMHGGYYRCTNRRVMELRPEFNLKPSPNYTPAIALFAAVVGLVMAGGWLAGLIAGLWSFVGMSLVAIVLGGIGAFKATLLLCCDFNFSAVVKSVPLDRFDSVHIEVQPGQEWFKAGDLVFTKGQVETFRLAGVSRPEAFRTTCMKSHLAYVGVKSLPASIVPVGAA